MISLDNLYETSVYTIVHANTIRKMISNEIPLVFEQDKKWTSAEKSLHEARKLGKELLLVLGAADKFCGIVAYALIENIEILSEDFTEVATKKKKTRVALKCIHFFPECNERYSYISIDTLVLKSSGNHLDRNYQSSYVIFKTESITNYLIDKPVRKSITTKTQYNRDKKIADLVYTRCGGVCELCGKRGFLKDSGEHYIEVHHIIPLSKGGRDSLDNVTGLCPDCHRELHHGCKRDEKLDLLLSKLKGKVVSK